MRCETKYCNFWAQCDHWTGGLFLAVRRGAVSCKLYMPGGGKSKAKGTGPR